MAALQRLLISWYLPFSENDFSEAQISEHVGIFVAISHNPLSNLF